MFRSWLMPLALLMLTGCDDGDDIPLQPTLVVFPAETLDFEQAFVGTSPAKSLQLRNDGQQNLLVQSVEKSGDGAFTLTAPAPSLGEVPYQKVSFVQVIFTPSEARDYRGELVIRSNADNLPETRVALSGRGVAPP